MNMYQNRELSDFKLVSREVGVGSSSSVDVCKRVVRGFGSRTLSAIKRYYLAALTRRQCVSYSRGGHVDIQTGIYQLEREIEILRALKGRCSTIVNLDEVVRSDSCIFLIFKYAGAPLMCYIDESNAYSARSLDPIYGSLFAARTSHMIDVLTEDDCVICLKQILSGMSFLRDKNIVHKDVKPENILLNYPLWRWRRYVDSRLQDMQADWVHDRPIEITICDFDNAETITNGRIFDAQGTVLFSPPEVFGLIDRDVGVDGFARDAWSVGMVAYCMLVGYHPVPTCSSSFEFQLSLLKLQQEGGCIVLPDQIIGRTPLREAIEGLLNMDPSARLTVNDALSLLTV